MKMQSPLSTGAANAGGWRKLVDPQRVGAVYVLLLMVVIFSLWIPDLFFRPETIPAILNDNALLGLLALSLLVALAAGEFDLSIGFMMGAAAMLVAWLLGNTGLSPALAVLVTLGAAAIFGLLNGIIVVKLRIHSFIATLASGSILEAMVNLISGGSTLQEGVDQIESFALGSIGDFNLPVFYMLAIATVFWVLLSHTALGRRIYASGLGREAANLAGVRTDKLRMGVFVVSGVGAAFAGVVAVAQIGSASVNIGPGYLIPAFAAAFLGATQLKPGLFNAWGIVLAVVLLGVLNGGLNLAGVPVWVPQVATGLVLIMALALGEIRQRLDMRARRREWRGAPGGPPDAEPGEAAEATAKAESDTDRDRGDRSRVTPPRVGSS